MSDQKSTERPAARQSGEGLFSRGHLTATTSFVVTMFLTGFTALAVVPTLPTAAEALDGVSLFPLVAGAFVASSLLGGVLGGHWADRSGARRPLAAGMVLTVATLLVAATSVSIWQLAAGRFLDGLAAGMVAVSVNTAIGEAYPPRLRPRALALMSTSWIVPSLTGPPLAGVVTQWWSWRAVFFGLAALTLLPALALVAVLRRGRTWAAEEGTVPVSETVPVPAAEALSGAETGGGPEAGGGGGAVVRPPLLLAGVVSAGAAVGQYGVSGWSVLHGGFAVAGAVLLAVLAPRLLPPGTWRALRGLPATVLLRGLGSGVFFTLEAFVPLLLVAERKVSAVVIGLLFTSASVVWAGASFVQGRVLEGRPRHVLVRMGAVVQAVAVVVAVAGTLPGAPALTAAAAMPVAAVGMGMLEPSLIVLSLAHSGAGRLGYASAAMQTNQNLGQIGVLGLSTFVLNVCLALGVSGLSGYGAAFALLLVPSVVLVVLAGRTRC